MSDSGATDPMPLGRRLREKLPEILIEAFSVVAALLLAFAIDNWNEQRQEHERAMLARSAIVIELRENREEVAGVLPVLGRILGQLRAAANDRDGDITELRIELNIALLSAAAWQATMITRASREMDLAWTTRIAKVYELQENYLRAQNLALDQLSSIPPDRSLDSRTVALSMLPRLSALEQLAKSLEKTYDEALAGEAAAPASAPASR